MAEGILNKNCFDAVEGMDQVSIKKWLRDNKESIVIIGPENNNKSLTCFTRTTLRTWAEDENYVVNNEDQPGEQAFRLTMGEGVSYYIWYEEIASQAINNKRARIFEITLFDESAVRFSWNQESLKVYSLVPVKVSDLDMLLNRSDEIQEEEKEEKEQEVKEERKQIAPIYYSRTSKQIAGGNCFDDNNSNETTVVAWLKKSNQNIIIVDPRGKITCFTRKKLLDAIAPRNQIHPTRSSSRFIYPLKTASQTWYIVDEDFYHHVSFEELEFRVFKIVGPSWVYAGYETWELIQSISYDFDNFEVKKSPEEEEEEESQLTDIVANGNCFGWISLENLNIRNWLKHNSNAIIVIFPDNSITCYLKDKLNDMMNDPTYGFHRCRWKDNPESSAHGRALKLPSGNGSIYYVWTQEIKRYLSHSNPSRILKFDVEKQIARWNFSISLAMIEEFDKTFHWRNPSSSRIGSSWKCQEGTEINVYHITPKSVKAIEQIIEGRRD
jgi:hypothetical protein